jgi:perosamine synthetase
MIPLAKPNIPEEAKQKVLEVLNSGMLVQGKEVLTFEEKVATFLNVKHAICVSSGTATLHLSLIALNIGHGDEVIVPAFSYVATANVIELVGAKPVFVDIDINTFNIDITKIETAITPKTKAIMPVHEFGLASDISQIVDLANKHKLFVIEDAACALGAQENSQFVGSFGNLGSFSFHPRKAITSGEGGIVTTNDDSLAKEIRILRNHGIEIVDGEMDFVRAGYNYRMTDIQAALVSSQFDNIDSSLNYKQQLADIYFNEINNSKLILPIIPDYKNHTWQTFHVMLENEKIRNELISYLKNNGIMTNYGAQCIPSMTFYQDKYGYDSPSEYSNSYKAYKNGIAVPLYDLLTTDDIQYISKTLNNFLIKW